MGGGIPSGGTQTSLSNEQTAWCCHEEKTYNVASHLLSPVLPTVSDLHLFLFIYLFMVYQGRVFLCWP